MNLKITIPEKWHAHSLSYVEWCIKFSIAIK